MPKISANQVDSDEKKIMLELQKNSNENIDVLAKRCGFSRQKVWRIINKLESDKTIWGYHAVIDAEKLHQKSYILLIKKANTPISDILDIILSREAERIAEELDVFIFSSSYLHGSYDWQITFRAEDIRIAKKFCEKLNRLYQTHVGEIMLIEEIFAVKYCGVRNPDIKKLKEFV
jgi:DNA-binding Lrp family transcriptional regulator